MKKVALSLLAFGLVGAMAFADGAAAPAVSIHDWGRQIFVLTNQDNSGYSLGLGTSWGNAPRIVGLNITADSGNAGFSITPSADNGTFGLTDQNKAWIKPFDGVTVEAGINLQTDTWRGTADYGTWDWLRLPGTHGDSFTFSRIGEAGATQFAVEYNKDGIGAWAMVQNPTGSATTDLGHSIQAGAAYTINSIGVLKAQVLGAQVSGAGPLAGTGTTVAGVGNTGVYSDETSTYQVAFNLSAVQNLYEEVGVWLPSDGSKAGWSYQASDYLSYKLGAPTVHARILATGYNGKNAGASDLGLEAGAGIDYALDGGLSVGADFTYLNSAALNAGNDKTNVGALNTAYNNTNSAAIAAGTKTANPYGTYNDTALVGFGAYLSKSFANGMIGIGFEYSTINWGGGNVTGVSADKAHWAIPVKMEEWF